AEGAVEMDVVPAVALEGALDASSPAPPDRSLTGRRLRAYLSWLLLGGVGTYVDKIHEAAGVVAYPNTGWVGERFFVSPVYVGAAMGMLALYAVVVGDRRGRQGWLGGRPLSPVDFMGAVGLGVVAYQVSALLGAPERTHGVWPYALGGGLLAWA